MGILVPRSIVDRMDGLGDEVLVGRIALHEACERVRAKEEAASAKATDAIG